ncbi:MAG TPA: flagellar basal body P-ring formation chaperone FlgA [Bryobacteraceae bacterium]|jgi:flagella basal body P-ring formation protein FlgA|nr:flagellar basal body P-ring formation chaperone FlgA [Bryobacteraceae bacterium]
MFALIFAVLQPLACHLIHADWIYGRDLAAAAPAFSSLAPDAHIGLAPFPGLQRTFHIGELKRLALANHVAGEIASDVCFTWDVKVPDRMQMAAAMRRTLAGRAATIDIVQSSLISAPSGEMVFPLSGFTAGSDKPSLWRGYVQYTGSMRFPIWANVLVRVKEQHVAPLNELKYGDSLQLDQLTSQTYEGPLRRDKYLLDARAFAGFRCMRSISAGTELTEDMLAAPLEVNRGDTVDAIVQTGGAKLDLKAIAETDGRKGQVISVRNPHSGRVFRGRVEEKGVVTVVPGGSYGLVVEAKLS